MSYEALKSRLDQISDKLTGIEVKSDTRIFLNCDSENALAVNKFVFEEIGARFCIETGIDCDDSFEIIYHYSYDVTGCIINIKASIFDRDNPSIDSITPIVSAAEWIEREIHDILGINFNNHPRMERLILSDDWPEGVYPMRKDSVKQ